MTPIAREEKTKVLTAYQRLLDYYKADPANHWVKRKYRDGNAMCISQGLTTFCRQEDIKDEKVVLDPIKRALRTQTKDSYRNIMDYNDDPYTKIEDICRLLERSITMIEEKLTND